MPSPLKPLCYANGRCTIQLATNQLGLYRVDAHVGGTHAAERYAARLLSQTTFGATSAEITAFLKDHYKMKSGQTTSTAMQAAAAAWIHKQMDSKQTPPTLLREYYRARVNPRVDPSRDLSFWGSLIKPCDIKSRWDRYAFKEHDENQVLVATEYTYQGQDYVTLSVNGEVRTQMPLASLKDRTGKLITKNVSPSKWRWQMCRAGGFLNEGVGGKIEIGQAGGKKCDKKGRAFINNPAVWFDPAYAAKTDYIHVFKKGDLELSRGKSAKNHPFFLLKRAPAKCSLSVRKDKNPIIGVPQADDGLQYVAPL